MQLSKLLRWLFVALVCVIALPGAALAQSAIGGTVKDTSGAVLPGVTVEVASDVLIEKTKTVSTDGQGQYTIVDLRPGVYIITFSLQGFNTFKREGLELPSNFTATVNADMKVGALEESVTVSGSSPVVDVQSNQKTQVLSRDVLDAVPTGKTIQGLGQLVVGVTLSSPDVGGSRAMQQAYFAVHGVGASGAIVTVDGLLTNGNMADGAVMAYHNEAMIQEAVYQTAGGTAETITGGITMNLVPKDGGNRFAGALKYGKSPASWQGDNLTPRLQALGVKRGRQDLQLLRVQHRRRRADHEGQAVVLRRVPPRALRQADRQHVRPAGWSATSRRRSTRAWRTRAPATRASPTRRWTTRWSA